MYVNMDKDKSLTVRIPKEIYQQYLDIAIRKSNEERRIVKVSEIVRHALENYIKVL